MTGATERWLPIPGYPDYEVSDLGHVRGLPRSFVRADGRPYNRPARMMRGFVTIPDGYRGVRLSPQGSNRAMTLKIHRLVLLAFVGPAPDGTQACHNDGNPANNSLSNLRWDTPSANMADRLAHGNNPQANKTHCKHGHPFDERNTIQRRAGGRQCRECLNAHKRARRRRSDMTNGDLFAVGDDAA